MVAKVFISYRRDDTKYQARMIYNAFRAVVPRDSIFVDVDSIPPGVDYVEFLEGWVEQCEVLLALIGPGWADENRLRNDNDFVRFPPDDFRTLHSV
jgi:TIR domain